MDFTRVVLKPQVTVADVRTAGMRVAEWEKWSFTRHLEDEPFILCWKSVDERCTIAYMQDPLREVRYYHLTGTDLDRHAATVRSHLATYDRAEIEAMVA